MTRPPGASAKFATTLHEAGHAVVAHVLGISVRSVSVERTAERAGQVRHAPHLSAASVYDLASARNRMKAERLILASLAGQAAQRRHRPSSYRHYHARQDSETARDLALEVCGGSEGSAGAYIRWLEIVAGEMVERHWPEIERVARAVLVLKRLDRSAFLKALNTPS